MKIEKIEVLMCDAGWRPWVFVKMTTNQGLVGYSEITDSNGSPHGMAGVVRDLTPLLLGRDPREWLKRSEEMHMATRQSPGGIVHKAISGCVNAMLDIVGKHYNLPVYALFGGPIRKKFVVYWSHFGTTRVRAHEVVGVKAVRKWSDFYDLLCTASEWGFLAIKCNVLQLRGNSPSVYMPGFGRTSGGPALNLENQTLDSIRDLANTFCTMRKEFKGTTPQLIIDLNFNFKPEGFKKIARILSCDGSFSPLWLELDCYDSSALLEVKNSTTIPICSGENLYGLRQYSPFLARRAMDIASVDILWNGLPESLSIAKMAELHEINVAPHNFNSALGDAIAAHFCALVPNLRMCEYDMDDVPWKYELVSHSHKVESGSMTCSGDPGWGVTFNENILQEHPWPKV